jgi:ribokinase
LNSGVDVSNIRPMKILNFGSLNIDHVYRVAHISAPGETLASRSLATFAGGKGANQSVALARAGAKVYHAGKVGEDGRWLLKKLTGYGAKTDFTRIGKGPTGHAIIQVDDNGQNSIVLFAGENKQITRKEVDQTLRQFDKGDILLLQNEINDIPYIMKAARKRGLKVCFNPAPFGPEIMKHPLKLVDILILNETEGAGLSGTKKISAVADALARKFPKCEVLLTLGKQGVLYCFGKQRIKVPSVKVKAVDTTAAGDTFIGFYLAARAAGKPVVTCLKRACLAAAISVTRPGAMDSIPAAREVKI